MTKILVTGANGQLGNEIRNLAGSFPDFEFLFTDVAELNITDEKAIENCAATEKIAVIINCAAYTAVDKAEQEQEMQNLQQAQAMQAASALQSGMGPGGAAQGGTAPAHKGMGSDNPERLLTPQ